MSLVTSDEINGDLIKIKERLHGVENVLQDIETDIYPIQYISKYISPHNVLYKTDRSAIDRTPFITDSIDYHHIFILQPPHHDLQYICNLIGTYIGKIYSIRHIWSIHDQSIVICIRLQHWYSDKFTQIFRSELVIQLEFRKYNDSNERVLLRDHNLQPYNIVLGRRKTRAKTSDNIPLIHIELNTDNLKRIII